MVKTKKIQLTSKRIDDLITMFRSLPEKPVGHHLSDDVFIRYAMEEIMGEELQIVDEHLSSCIECLTKLENLLKNYTVWQGTDWKNRFDSLEKQCLIACEIEEDGISSEPSPIETLSARFIEKNCSYTALVYELVQNNYLSESGVPDEFIVLIAQVLQSYSKEGVIKEVITAEKEEQILRGKQLTSLLGIGVPTEVFTRFSEFFGCTKWEINPKKGGFLAINKECRFRDIFRELGESGAVNPCDICCLNLMEGLVKSLEPDCFFYVEETLWDGDKCRVTVLREVA